MERRAATARWISEFPVESEVLLGRLDAVDFVTGASRWAPSELDEALGTAKKHSTFRPLEPDALVVCDLHDVSSTTSEAILGAIQRSPRARGHALVFVTEGPSAHLLSAATSCRASVFAGDTTDAMRVLLGPRLIAPRDPLDAALDEATQRYRWSAQQRAIVRLCAEGVAVKCVGERLGVSYETVKTQIARLRKKARASDTDSLVMAILHDAIQQRAR